MKADIVFRVDASIEIGTGHVIRCLALADGLAASGERSAFVSRSMPEKLRERIQRAGHAFLELPAGALGCDDLRHSSWLGTTMALDAATVTPIVSDLQPKWLVVDHYALDARWERAVRPNGTKLLVIDDLADRAHDCDLLVDQNLGRKAADYAGLVPVGVSLLIGPSFALLRPDFAELRAESLARREVPRLQRVLVTMGGVDPDDVTGRVLDALDASALPPDVAVTVVMGPTAPWLDRVRARAGQMRLLTEVAVGLCSDDMARVIAESDLAIGAGGTTTWERCVLGVPTVIVQIADNQAGPALALVAEGAAVNPGSPEGQDFAKRLGESMLRAEARLAGMSARAANVCDGDGLGRVLSRMMKVQPSFRPAGPADARRVWEWRAAGIQARFNRSGVVPDYAHHHAWFMAAMQDRTLVFRVLMMGPHACGYLRLDLSKDKRATVSLCLADDMRGKGLAALLLQEAHGIAARLSLNGLDADVHPENTASMRCFLSGGYRAVGQTGEFTRFSMELERTE